MFFKKKESNRTAGWPCLLTIVWKLGTRSYNCLGIELFFCSFCCPVHKRKRSVFFFIVCWRDPTRVLLKRRREDREKDFILSWFSYYGIRPILFFHFSAWLLDLPGLLIETREALFPKTWLHLALKLCLQKRAFLLHLPILKQLTVAMGRSLSWASFFPPLFQLLCGPFDQDAYKAMIAVDTKRIKHDPLMRHRHAQIPNLCKPSKEGLIDRARSAEVWN